MINSDPSQIKSIKPLKGFVGVYNPDYLSNKQQDVGEFINYLLSHCGIIKTLTKFSVHKTFQCIICTKSTNRVDEMNIRYEDLNGNSIAQILKCKDKVPSISKNCTNCQKDTNSML